MKYECISCGKKTKKLHQPKSIYSLTEGYCEECAAKL